MNKWIEQEACKTLKLSVTNLNPMELDAFIKGAQSALAKVKDIIDETGDNETPEADEFNEGRESLRQEILEKLKD